jgi:N-acetylmuramoyl-L-alanine amidase
MKSMRSFAERILLAGAIVVCCAVSLSAQTTAAARYTALHNEDARLLQSASGSVEEFRSLVSRYWAFVRRYPTSGYSDNAIFQAAGVSFEAFKRFSDPSDRERALELFQWLVSQYPRSSLKAQAAQEIARLSTASATSTVRSVRRDVMPDVVRVTIEMDHEVSFAESRAGDQAGVRIELKGTRPAPALGEGVYRFKDDLVREVRVERLDRNATRVSLDFRDNPRYSVFTLYSPYRLVIDADRRAANGPLLLTAARPVRPLARRSMLPLEIEPLVVTPVSPVLLTAKAVTPSTPATPPPSVPRKPNVEPSAVLTRPTPVPPPPASSPVAVLKPTTVAPAPVAPQANANGSFSVARQLGLGVARIVIDPGHGGHDPGASGFGVSEAELVLDVALRLEKLLRAQPSVDVVLTRRTNDFVTLEERTDIANRQSADLFLSIHANASDAPAVRGVETYFLNFALNRQAEAVAARENAASGRTMSSLPGIIKAITLNSKLNESRDFAGLIQRTLVTGLGGNNKAVKDLGVKQAPFMVLVGASMPSVLAEIAFVTNRQDAALLKTTAYRQKIAESLLAGILKYQETLKKVETASLAH